MRPGPRYYANAAAWRAKPYLRQYRSTMHEYPLTDVCMPRNGSNTSPRFEPSGYGTTLLAHPGGVVPEPTTQDDE
jgi:hypothetical protein